MTDIQPPQKNINMTDSAIGGQGILMKIIGVVVERGKKNEQTANKSS